MLVAGALAGSGSSFFDAEQAASKAAERRIEVVRAKRFMELSLRSDETNVWELGKVWRRGMGADFNPAVRFGGISVRAGRHAMESPRMEDLRGLSLWRWKELSS